MAAPPSPAPPTITHGTVRTRHTMPGGGEKGAWAAQGDGCTVVGGIILKQTDEDRLAAVPHSDGQILCVNLSIRRIHFQTSDLEVSAP